MGYYRCLSCGLRTAFPESHPTCQLTRWCTCGSGGHPRPCEAHPGAYEEHLAELNEEAEADG